MFSLAFKNRFLLICELYIFIHINDGLIAGSDKYYLPEFLVTMYYDVFNKGHRS